MLTPPDTRSNPAVARPANLPLSLTSFVGRAQELAELKHLFPSTRLLTLTGAGGCGKTRLALQLAADLKNEPHFEDGTVWVELAPLSDPALVPQIILQALGLSEQPSRALTDTLLDYFRDKRFLLVLDNCEHLIQACAELAPQLLQQCPDLRILATTREALSVAGEQVWVVPSLSLPAQPTLDLMRVSDAVRLFVERAAAVQSDFELSETNAPFVANLCRRLDGVPLAIELAAARVNVLDVAQIAARLDNALRLLTEGKRTAPPRHRTLRATLDWSYDLLSPDECILFRRLSVFVGGWTLEAAEAVCSGNGLELSPILDLITGLVKKSFVLVERRQSGVRYRMLQTIREYAAEKIDSASEGVDLASRHLDYFLAFAEHAESDLSGPNRLLTFNRLELDYANLITALDSSLNLVNGVEKGLLLAGVLNQFWINGSHQTEGRLWLDRLLLASRLRQVSPYVRAQALYAAGVLASDSGNFTVARELLDESASLFRQVADQRRLAYALLHLAKVIDSQGDNARARVLANTGTSIFRDLQDKWGLAYALAGQWHIFLNDAVEASMVSSLQESLALFQEVGDRWSIARPLYSLGNFMAYLGKNAEARRYFEQFLPLAHEMKSLWDLAVTQMVLGEIAASERDYARAETLFHSTLPLLSSLGVERFKARILLDMGQLAFSRGDTPKSVSLLASSLTAAFQCDSTDPMRSDTIAFCFAALAVILAKSGRISQAAQLVGAVRSLVDATAPGYMFVPFSRFTARDYARAQAFVRARLDRSAFEMAFEKGRQLNLEQAITVALSAAAHWSPSPQPDKKKLHNLGGLTSRERQVTRLLALGKSNREIAAELVVSERTVENHVGNILSKLSLHSRTQIAVWALANSLLEPPA